MMELSVTLFRAARRLVPKWLRGPIDKTYEAVLKRLPLRARIAVLYFRTFRALPNLNKPKTFSEKCQRFKLQPDPRIPPLVDKVSAKSIIAGKIGTEHVVPMLYCGDFLPPIEERNWPLPYVIKANHGSGFNIYIRNERDKNWESIESGLKTWLATDFGYRGGELYYLYVKRKVFVEPFISKTGELPVDYKIYCFGGEPTYIQIDTGREKSHKRVFYDTNWQRQSFRYGYETEPSEIPKPENLSLLLECARTLAEGHAFVRTDFYVVDGQIFFGEMGFTPESGFTRFYPAETDLAFGDLWPINSAPAPHSSW